MIFPIHKTQNGCILVVSIQDFGITKFALAGGTIKATRVLCRYGRCPLGGGGGEFIRQINANWRSIAYATFMANCLTIAAKEN